MQQVTCPGCGAPVEFKSTASVMAVCGFCKTTILKDAGSIKNLGKMSEVLEDYSPLQIGSSGEFGGRAFSVIGRIQLRYDEGFWNEWYVQFADGTNGWLSDGSGQFTVTAVQPSAANLPLFDKLVPGNVLHLDGQSYVTSDVRTAQCTGGQGELPFQVGAGYQAKVADFRSGERFLTLDYSDEAVRVYSGQGVQLADLKPQLLRESDQIQESAGRFHGKVQALNCPSCGSPVNVVPGITVHISCPSCHAQVDTSGATAEVLQAGARVEAVHFTLALGSTATIDGTRYTLLGAMRRAETDEDYSWSEYLLYAPGRKFIWLVETDQGWQRADALDRWPAWDGAGRATLDGVAYERDSQYAARVVVALGSFNWRVSVGGTTKITEYVGRGGRLSAEVTPAEMTWSRSVPVPPDQLGAWFGTRVPSAQATPTPRYRDTAKRLVIVLLVINAIPLLFSAGAVLPYVLFAAAAIYLPAFFLDKLDSGGQ